ncbi:larval cuticle protein 1-like isoform X2 [Coccinella septempunctata]|nr:larval cuticle protein 1-like isoform X2 [Coccinella septempunctata]
MSCVISAPVGNDADATIISYEYEQKENGYFFSYTTSNGITREENAVIVDDPNGKNEENQIIRINGYYSYTDKDNNLYRVDYVADENGYIILEKPKLSPSQTATQGLSIPKPAYKPQLQPRPPAYKPQAPPIVFPKQETYLPRPTYKPQSEISSAALASLGGS